MSKVFNVRVPFAGVIAFEIEASTEEEAIAKAFETGININLTEDDSTNNNAFIFEWEMYTKMVEGNICYINFTDAEAEET